MHPTLLTVAEVFLLETECCTILVEIQPGIVMKRDETTLRSAVLPWSVL